MEWDAGQEGFDVYRNKKFDDIIHVRNLQGNGSNAEFYNGGQTRFRQGKLENCWLAAAIESLRQNGDAFRKVVPENCGHLEFRFWHKGAHQRTVKLASDAVPTRDGDLIFMCNVEGSEYWGILLEKAYAKWVGSYEFLANGFWTDAIQSFTGGVVERIKLRDADDRLFDIMLTAYTKGSSLCCIKKEHLQDTAKVPDSKEPYHACCIVQIDDSTRQIRVLDPYTQEHHDLPYETFTKEYDRLDMCHTNLDNLSALQGKNILQTPWEKQMFQLQLENGCVEFKINLTGTDDEQESCILVIEVIQKIKPDEEEEEEEELRHIKKELGHIQPWDRLVCLEVEVNGEEFAFATEYPQESRCLFRNPGKLSVKVSTEAEKHEEIYVRLFSKTSFEVEQNERLINIETH